MVLDRLALVPADARILATDEASGAELASIAERRGFELLVGPSEDVLSRYCLCIRKFGLDLVIRATGDNPLISHELAVLLLEGSNARAAHYAAFIGLPLGMGVELVSAPALLEAEVAAADPFEREHVCPHLYRNPGRYRIVRDPAPADFLLPEGRVTVDLPSDYEALLRLYGALYDGRPIPTSRVMEVLRAGVSAPRAGRMAS
jgi:spore coat polysaccharide biosynthesis protein SpsF